MSREHSTFDAWSSRVGEALLALLVVVAPLPFGSVTASGRVMIELFGLALGGLWALYAFRHPSILPNRWIVWGLTGLVALGALQFFPLPEPVVKLLSPRTVAIMQMTEAPESVRTSERELLGDAASDARPRHALSVDPIASASAVRLGVAFALIFLATTWVTRARGGKRLALALLVAGAFQALYGTLSLAAGHDKIWHKVKEHYLDVATGTYVNGNHYACMLVMVIACGVGLLMRDSTTQAKASRAHMLVRFLDERGSRRMIGAIVALVCLVGLLLSFSRAGIAVGVLALASTILLCTPRERIRRAALLIGMAVLLASVPLIQLGGTKLVDQYGQSAEALTTESGRATVWGDSLRAATDFPFAGAGFGTFASIYPLYRSPEIRKYYAHAHNDYIQLGLESGLIGIAFAVMFAWGLSGYFIASLSGHKGRLATGFACGLGAFLLLSLVDFNFHIPANIAIACVLAGALEGLPWLHPD